LWNRRFRNPDANRVVTLKFAIAEVQHQETFFVAPLDSNQMILGMPWLERVSPDIDWKLRSLTFPTTSTHSIPVDHSKPLDDAVPTSSRPLNTQDISHPDARESCSSRTPGDGSRSDVMVSDIWVCNRERVKLKLKLNR
jgi:hypothetical protein